MSLLHDALKKAERTGTAVPGRGGVSVDSEERGGSHKLVFILLAVISLLLLFFTYQKFLKRPNAGGVTSQKTTEVQGPDGALLLEGSSVMIQQGRYEEARDAIEKALFANNLSAPKTVEAYNNLGYVLKKLGRNDEALQRYNKALSLDPQCAECQNNLGVLYLSNKDFNEAESHFREASTIRPEYAEPYLHLALLMEARGDFAAAKEQYLKYTKLAHGVSADFLLKVQERMSALGAL